MAEEGYCYWAAWRTLLPPDTVAARFAGAYAALGFTGERRAARGDTALVSAGPTPLGDARGGVAYASRVVAFRRGDSTVFRPFVSMALPPGGWRDRADSARRSGLFLGLCNDLMHAAGTHAIAPRQPGAEDSLAVWDSRP